MTHPQQPLITDLLAALKAMVSPVPDGVSWFEFTVKREGRARATIAKAEAALSAGAVYPIRAHVGGCPKALSVPVDMCDCGGRDFTPEAAGAVPQQEPQESYLTRVVRRVAELPDRTSPDDWPDAMLVTADELRDILQSEQPAVPSLPAPQEQDGKS